MPRTIATTVAPRALRSIRAGHPWVFDRSIRSQKHQPEAGDLAVIFDKKRNFVGIGLADPDSPIAIRMLHHGSPTAIDHEFFAGRIEAALKVRAPLLADDATDGFRLINGENDGLPGLIADQYADVIVTKIYTSAWLPHLDHVIDHLVAHRSPSAVVVRASRSVSTRDPTIEGKVACGELSDPLVEFAENNLRFVADVIGGNKTGHFLDQRENRQRVRSISDKARVLDVFCSTGGFSVHAAAGGAAAITAVDISAGALAAAETNMALNGVVPPDGFTVTCGDAFDVMSNLCAEGRTFDVVIVDPPSFARKQADVDRALAAYRRLTRLAVKLVAPGGTLVQASCSARISEDTFRSAFTDELEHSRARFTSIRWYGHPLDHPVSFTEGRYLKAVFATRS